MQKKTPKVPSTPEDQNTKVNCEIHAESHPELCVDCGNRYPEALQGELIVGNLRCILGREAPSSAISYAFYVQLRWNDGTWHDWSVDPMFTEKEGLESLKTSQRRHPTQTFRLIVRVEKEIFV